MTAKDKPTVEEWIEMGRKCKQLNRDIIDLHMFMHKFFPKAKLSPFFTMNRILGKMKSWFDDRVFEDNDLKEHFNDNTRDLIGVFYGQMGDDNGINNR